MPEIQLEPHVLGEGHPEYLLLLASPGNVGAGKKTEQIVGEVYIRVKPKVARPARVAGIHLGVIIEVPGRADDKLRFDGIVQVFVEVDRVLETVRDIGRPDIADAQYRDAVLGGDTVLE